MVFTLEELEMGGRGWGERSFSECTASVLALGVCMIMTAIKCSTEIKPINDKILYIDFLWIICNINQ